MTDPIRPIAASRCHPIFRVVVLALLLEPPGMAKAAIENGPAAVVVGREVSYTVRRNDSLVLIGARFGTSPGFIAATNGLAPGARLREGQVLKIDNRHIVPFFLQEGVLVNVPQRMLFFFHDGSLVSAYPVAVGRPDWPTATGEFQVRELRRRPTWHVPLSIQAEMRRHGERVVTRVLPGPRNPLGDYWIGLEGSGCGIHGTNAPASIYGFRTHGCIRLHPDDISELFSQVSLGTAVRIAYEPILLAVASEGVFLEVNPDIYRHTGDANRFVRTLAASSHVEDALDWRLISDVIRGRQGTAQRVDRAPETEATERPSPVGRRPILKGRGPRFKTVDLT